MTLSYNDLHGEFKGHSLESISLAVTLALMTRPIGGVIFGILADRFGRKWPFIANCSLLIVFVLLTGFCKSYEQFLAVRALFGVAMGGLYGNAAATALEDVPSDTRGLLSGLYRKCRLFSANLNVGYSQSRIPRHFGYNALAHADWASLLYQRHLAELGEEYC